MKNINKIISTVLISSMLLQPISTFALEKKESIYSNLDYDGRFEKMVVNNHLLKFEEKEVEDNTVLKNIINLNGEEKYNLDGNCLTWSSKGKDIYYRGETDKESPISFDIKYYLDGKEMNPKNMVGKKGQVEIRVSLENREYNSRYNLHTPFVVTLGTTISNKDIRDINVSNGTIVDTGTNSMVVALAAPGLYDDLKVDELKKLDEIVISYDTNKFSLKNMYFVATPKLLDKVDINNINKLSTLSKSINVIQDNMDKIEDGSKTLVSSTDTLKSGASKLRQGSKDLNSGLKELKQGIDLLDSGAVTLNEGLNYMYNQVSLLNRMISDMGLDSDTINSLNYLKATDEKLYNIKVNYINYGLKDLSEEGISNLALSDEEKINLITVKRTYEANPDLVELGANNYSAVSSLTTITNYLSKLGELEEGLKSAALGSLEISNGLNNAKDGTDRLVVGSSSLLDGASKLDEGADAFENGVKDLSSGIEALNDQGINVLNRYANVINNYTVRGKNLTNLSKNYSGFASNNSNETIFIYKVKSVK